MRVRASAQCVSRGPHAGAAGVAHQRKRRGRGRIRRALGSGDRRGDEAAPTLRTASPALATAPPVRRRRGRCEGGERRRRVPARAAKESALTAARAALAARPAGPRRAPPRPLPHAAPRGLPGCARIPRAGDRTSPRGEQTEGGPIQPTALQARLLQHADDAAGAGERGLGGAWRRCRARGLQGVAAAEVLCGELDVGIGRPILFMQLGEAMGEGLGVVRRAPACVRPPNPVPRGPAPGRCGSGRAVGGGCDGRGRPPLRVRAGSRRPTSSARCW